MSQQIGNLLDLVGCKKSPLAATVIMNKMVNQKLLKQLA